MVEDAEWRPVVGFEGLYEVSSDGRVRSLDRIIGAKHGIRRWGGKTLRPDDSTPYLVVSLCRNSKPKKALVHKLVAEAFIGPRPKDLQIDHINLDKRDNRLENLRYVTRSENRQNCPVLAVSGFKHVHLQNEKRYNLSKPWQARVNRVYLGNFATAEAANDAVEEYLQAANR